METVDDPPAKKVKLLDLPLSAAQRASIDKTLTKFKKQGSFDQLRKNVYSDFESSDAKAELVTALQG